MNCFLRKLLIKGCQPLPMPDAALKKSVFMKPLLSTILACVFFLFALMPFELRSETANLATSPEKAQSANREKSAATTTDIEKLINAYQYHLANKKTHQFIKKNIISKEVGQQFLDRIEKESNQHTKINLQVAYRLSRRHRWAEAENLLQVLSKQVVDKTPVREAMNNIKQRQGINLLKFRTETALEKHSWLHQKYKFNQVKNRSTLRNPLTRIEKHWIEFKLNRHNQKLLDLALKNQLSGDLSSSKRCLEAMEPEKLGNKDKKQFVALAKKINFTPQIKRRNLNSPDYALAINLLTSLLEQNMKDKNLLAIKLNLIELAPLTSRRSLHYPLVKRAELALATEIQKLDQAADDLYRTEKPLEAYEIWESLLQLDKENAAIQQKFERAKKVLGNIQTLRDQGNIATPGNNE